MYLFAQNSYAQQYYQLYYNTALNNQVLANHSARVMSENSYYNTYNTQVEKMEKVKESITKVVIMKDQIYKQLSNVNSALKQGKLITVMYSDYQKLLQNLGIMIDLTAENLEYAILITRFYEKVVDHALGTYVGIADQVTREEADYLMDPADRRNLLAKMHIELRLMNGWVLHINNYLRNAKKKPYLRHFKILNDWYVQDKALIQNTIMASNLITN